MRTLVLLALASCLAWSVGEYVAANPEAPPSPHAPVKGNMPYVELSHDNGNITNCWCYINGANTYAGDQYDTPSDWPWPNLSGIKYYVWCGWPDTTLQGFAVACWKMESGAPGAIVWPTNGNPIYNPNTGGNWIIQPVDPWINLMAAAPSGFLVGIGFLYSYPANDGFGVDNTGVGPYDWAYVSSAWAAAPYGKGSARALSGSVAVEPSTLGSVRALYR